MTFQKLNSISPSLKRWDILFTKTKAGTDCDLPPYSADIATAWGLDGEGWEWSSDDVVLRNYPQMFGTNDRIMEVSVRVGDEFFNGFAPWKTMEDKESAYATARCRAWLKARYALKGK